MNDELNELINRVGEAFDGHDLASVLTTLTYMVADACVQSEKSEEEFLQKFIACFTDAVNELKEEEDGNRSYH